MSLTVTQPRVTFAVPAWAERAVEASPADVLLVSESIPGATTLDAIALRVAVRDAYRRAFTAVEDRHVVRAWNAVPDITGPLGDGDRYIAFNAGRADAMRERFGDRLASRVPAASGVGCEGDALSIHVLATQNPGEQLENPRQTPAFRYSRRYGALPPCFARATRASLPAGKRLIVSGTAAIVGEESRAEGDASAQLAITLQNLRELIAADGGAASLDRFEDLRVYLPRSTFEDDELRAAARRAFARCEAVEFVRAELCRRELLIEIEGVATRPGAKHDER